MNGGTRSVLRIAGGSASGQVFLVLATVLSTRFFEPQHLGALGLITSIAAIGEVIMGGRLDLALPVAGSDKRFAQLSHLLESLTARLVLVGFTLSVFLYVIGMSVNGVLTPTQYAVALALPASALALRFDARIQMAIRNTMFPVVGNAQAISGFAQAITLLLAGLLAPSALAAISSFFVGRVAGSFLALRKAVPELPCSKIGILTAVRSYPSFPKYSMPTALINNVTVAMPIIYLTARFDVATAGVVFVVWRVMVSPTQMLGRAVGQVVYGKTAAMNNLAAIRSGTISSLKGSVCASLLLVSTSIALYFIDYSQLLDQGWVQVKYFVVPIGIVAASQLAASPLRNVFTRLGLQKRLMVLQFIRLMSCGIALVLATTFSLDVATSLWLFALALVLANCLLTVVILYTLSRLEKNGQFELISRSD